QEVNKKIDTILRNQRALMREEQKVEREEKEVDADEHEELAHLKTLEAVEREVVQELGPHPLTTITTRDIARGTIGAFIGVVAHFTFFYGIEVAEWLSITRATLLYPLSFAIGGIFMYATGFRKINDRRVLAFLPTRLIVLYIVALVVSALVLFFFSPEFTNHFRTAYKQLATVTLIAIVGACTADLIGKE
ncbi:MAG TPA: DUF2391 family protein, partial [Candidatus Nanoarchaeia archaeon]|nr:DUF2391 family protein [Candidatus Nanoarchaeia archaeon]